MNVPGGTSSPITNTSNIGQTTTMRFTSILHPPFKTRVVTNPTKHTLVDSFSQNGFTPASLLILSTPPCTDYTIAQVDQLTSKHPNLQVVMANTLSSHFPNSIVELWSFDRMTIKSHTPHKPSTSTRWSFPTSTLGLNFENTLVRMPVANGTVLRNGVLSMMYYTQGQGSMTNLQHLDIDIPLSLKKTEHYSHLKKLNRVTMEVIQVDGNVLKQLDVGSPARVLMGLLEQEGIKTAVDVFAKLTMNDGTRTVSSMHKVIAGGGEWGPGADILVLEDANIVEGTLVDFLVVPEDVGVFGWNLKAPRFLENVDQDVLPTADFIVDNEECVPQDFVREDEWFAGSERGFEVDRLSYGSKFEGLKVEIQGV